MHSHSKKLLIFAATPPPHHGQSYAVQTLVSGLQREGNLTVYHVNSRFSDEFEEIGRFKAGKILRLLGYCAQAVWYRLRFGVSNLYYVPAPGKRTPIYRDWLVMFFCRLFFRQVIFHWHAVGLGEWVEKQAKPWERAISRFLLAKHDLSIVLARYNCDDAAKLEPRRCVIVPNGIPDPCPDFETALTAIRQARIRARRQLLAGQSLDPKATAAGSNPQLFRVLFLSLCTREKGLFACLEGVTLVNQQLRKSDSPIRATLHVAGSFRDPGERLEFEQRATELGLRFLPAAESQPAENVVTYHGFASGAEKRRLFAECDLFCFPTFYSAESFGLVLLEAMAFGLPIITTRWRSIPELMPTDYPGLVEPGDSQAIANTLEKFILLESPPLLRERFLAHFTEAQFIRNMQAAILDQVTRKQLTR